MYKLFRDGIVLIKCVRMHIQPVGCTKLENKNVSPGYYLFWGFYYISVCYCLVLFLFAEATVTSYVKVFIQFPILLP